MNQNIVDCIKSVEKAYGVILTIEKLDQEAALELIKWYQFYEVIENLEDFEITDYQEIAMKLINRWNSHYLCKNLYKFSITNYWEFIKEMIEKGDGGCDIVEYLEYFPKELHYKIALEVIKKNHWVVCENIKKFHGVDQQQVAEEIVKKLAFGMDALRYISRLSCNRYDLAKTVVEKLDKEDIEVQVGLHNTLISCGYLGGYEKEIHEWLDPAIEKLKMNNIVISNDKIPFNQKYGYF